MQRQRLPREAAVALAGGVDDEILAGLHGLDEAEGRAAQGGDRNWMDAGGVDVAGNLDDVRVAQRRNRGEAAVAVTDVEDHARRSVRSERVHEVESHLLVAAARDVFGAPAGTLVDVAGLGHVGRLAVGEGIDPRLSRLLGAREDGVVEGFLLIAQVLAAGLVLVDAGHGFAMAVVVEEVFVGEGAQRANPVRADGAGFFHGPQGRLVGEEAREDVVAADRQRTQPAEVVEAHVVEGHVGALLLGNAQGVQRAVDEPDGGVADADDALAEHGTHRLGDDPGRVREVDEPGVRAQALGGVGQLECRSERAERVAVAAHANGLLTEQPMVEAAVFVEDTSAGPAHAHRGEHEVGSGKCLVDVRCCAHGRGVREVQRGQHGHHRVEPAHVGVVQDDAVDVEGRIVAATRA